MNQRGSACTTKHTQLYPADETETQLQGIVNVGEAMKKREQVEKSVALFFFKQGEKKWAAGEALVLPYTAQIWCTLMCGR